MSYEKVVLESTIQRECNEILRDLGVPFIHFEGGGGNNRQHRRGVPDLLFFWKSKSYGIEIKTKKGRVKPHQQEWLDKLSKQGVVVGICRSVEDFLDLLKTDGIHG